MSETSNHPDDDWYLHEPLLTFTELAHFVGKSPCTIWRWFDKGCKSQKGMRVKLQGFRNGGRNATSLNRYQVFIRAINDSDNPTARSVEPLLSRLPESPTKLQAAKDSQACEAAQILNARGYDC
jgi:hypothetical protein